MADTVIVKGYRPFLRACDRAGRETRREVRSTFKKVGEIVRAEAAERFQSIDARSAAGYKTRVRQRGIAVEQSRRRVTGKRPDYGSLQMKRALLPALAVKEGEVEDEMERAIDTVADHFERR